MTRGVWVGPDDEQPVTLTTHGAIDRMEPRKRAEAIASLWDLVGLHAPDVGPGEARLARGLYRSSPGDELVIRLGPGYDASESARAEIVHVDDSRRRTLEVRCDHDSDITAWVVRGYVFVTDRAGGAVFVHGPDADAEGVTMRVEHRGRPDG